MTEKYIKDGQVGLLLSGGYGAGWSTWGDPALAYDKDLVQAFLEGGEASLKAITENKYPDAYLGGLDGIYLAWVNVGSKYYIEEYDGSESLITPDANYWEIA